MSAVQGARISSPETGVVADPRVEGLVNDVIGRVADKWTMLVLEVLTEHGEQRFTRLGELVGGISQKMLTQTLRQMERDGLVVRTVHPVIPPKVEYRLTDMGLTLSEASAASGPGPRRISNASRPRGPSLTGAPRKRALDPRGPERSPRMSAEDFPAISPTGGRLRELSGRIQLSRWAG